MSAYATIQTILCTSFIYVSSPCRQLRTPGVPTSSTNRFNLTSSGSIGYMIIDALDTMHIMGLASEYEMPRSGSLIRSHSTGLATATHSRLLSVFWVYYYPHIISHSTPCFWTRPSTWLMESCQSLGHPLAYQSASLI